MEGKLIKRDDDDYKLFVNDATFAQSKKSPYKKLSLKNCQAIERGYDLDELALEAFELDLNFQGDCNNYYERFAYKLGFQKAVEILGDKKFSEEDMTKAIQIAKSSMGVDNDGEHCYSSISNHEIIQSLQQTEWDVIIEMEPYHDGDFINDGKTHIIEAKLRYRLDSDGCLILKRK